MRKLRQYAFLAVAAWMGYTLPVTAGEPVKDTKPMTEQEAPAAQHEQKEQEAPTQQQEAPVKQEEVKQETPVQQEAPIKQETPVQHQQQAPIQQQKPVIQQTEHTRNVGCHYNSGMSAQVRLILPSHFARVWFDNHFTSQTGMDRVFVTPALDGCQQYSYRITVECNGRVQVLDVPIRAGETTTIDLR